MQQPGDPRFLESLRHQHGLDPLVHRIEFRLDLFLLLPDPGEEGSLAPVVVSHGFVLGIMVRCSAGVLRMVRIFPGKGRRSGDRGAGGIRQAEAKAPDVVAPVRRLMEQLHGEAALFPEVDGFLENEHRLAIARLIGVTVHRPAGRIFSVEGRRDGPGFLFVVRFGDRDFDRFPAVADLDPESTKFPFDRERLFRGKLSCRRASSRKADTIPGTGQD